MSSAVVKQVLFDGIIIGYLLVAVLLALFQPGEEQLLMLGRNSLVFLGSICVGMAVSLGVSRAGSKTLGEVLFAPPHKRLAGGHAKPWHKTFWGLQALLATFVTVIIGVFVTEMSVVELLDRDAVTHAGRLFRALADPNWQILPQAVAKIIETIFIAFMATMIAVPIAFVLSFLAAKNIMGRSRLGLTVYTVLRAVFNVSRSIEPILWAIIFSIWVGFGPFAGMLSLMIHSIASLAKQYSEAVESVSEGPIEGIQSTGANFVQTIWFAIVPQVVLPYLSFTIYRWDINVRMATIIGFVGGGGIGKMLVEYQGQAMWNEVGTIIVVVAAVVWLMDTFSANIREAIK